ncbi:MAG: biotin transporter BioY [Firmicutes bacterium]|nr:biotin transporter BioY [Bacillota bacterium]
MNRSVSNLTAVGLFVALISVLAQFSIPQPFSPIPFTGQIFGVMLVAAVLGSKSGLTCILAYLLLGTAGFPVFALAQGGLHVILGPTGGYLLGFIPGVYLLGKIGGDREKDGGLLAGVGILIFLAIIYLCGSLQLALVTNLNFEQAVIAGIIPYLPLDLLKAALVFSLVPRLRRTIFHTMEVE